MRVNKMLSLEELKNQMLLPTVVSIQNGRGIVDQTGAISIFHEIDGYRVFENYTYCVAKTAYLLRQFGVSTTAAQVNNPITFAWVRGTPNNGLIEMYDRFFPSQVLQPA